MAYVPAAPQQTSDSGSGISVNLGPILRAAATGAHLPGLVTDAVPADVELPARAREADLDGSLDRPRDAQVGREQVGGPRRDHRDPGLRPDHRVDAALHHAIAAPHEDQLCARLQCAPNLLRRLAALRHLDPERIVDAMPRERAAKLGQTALQRLPGVSHHRDPGHALSSTFSPLTRVANSAIEMHARPISAPDAIGPSEALVEATDSSL